MQFRAEMIAEFLEGEIVGDKNTTVSEFAKIEEGYAGAISFLANPKYENYIYESLSSIIIVDKEFAPKSPIKATLIKVKEPYAAFATLLRLYDENRPRPKGISPKASIAEGVVIGKDCYVGDFSVIESGTVVGDGSLIYPQCYIGQGVKIGNKATIYAGVKIYDRCVLGDSVTINSGAVIGADGFGFAPDAQGVYSKIPQLGNVVIEDNVDIGANSCIDRATMGSTIIRHGVKLDNLIQIGHNVEIGHDTVAAAQCGVAGSTKIGHNCMFGGQVGVSGHITIGNNVRMGSQSGVASDIPDNSSMLGSPPLPGIKFHRASAIFRNLPELNLRVINLEKELVELKPTK